MTEIVKASLENGIQKIRIRAEKGYHPAHIQLQKGIPAEITIVLLLQTVIRKFCLKKKVSWKQSA